MHSTILFSFAGLFYLASAQIPARLPAKRVAAMGAGQKVDGSVSVDDVSVSFNESRHDTVILAAGEHPLADQTWNNINNVLPRSIFSHYHYCYCLRHRPKYNLVL